MLLATVHTYKVKTGLQNATEGPATNDLLKCLSGLKLTTLEQVAKYV